MKKLITILLLIFLSSILCGQKSRARDLGIPFVGTTGQFNAITDVKGVEVGHSTIISGSGKNIVGEGPIRTGV
jgi:D-aminopeptidase